MRLIFYTRVGDGLVRKCTWNVPNWENRLRNCPKGIDYCEVGQNYRCNKWKNICFCQDDLCNQGSRMFKNSFIGNAMMVFLIPLFNYL